MRLAIRTEHLGKRYACCHPDRPRTWHAALRTGFKHLGRVGTFWALRNIDLMVPAGRTLGLVGLNGAGKSTLLRLIGGVSQPTEGSIVVQGRMSALFSLGIGFHDDLSGRENVHLSGVVQGLTKRQVSRRLEAIVDFAQIGDFIDEPLRTYSTGMRMRLAFAVAFHIEPEVLLIDEVLAVGDLAFQRKCLQRIEYFKGRGCTIVVSSHSPTTLRSLCDDVLWLQSGKIHMLGEASRVVDAYADAHDASGSREPQSTPVEEPCRIGTKEITFESVALRGRDGQPAQVLDRGDALSIEMRFRTQHPMEDAGFQVMISRPDGLICCDFWTLASDVGVSTRDETGLLCLDIHELALGAGHYFVQIGCYSRDWKSTFDYFHNHYGFSVRGPAAEEAILQPRRAWHAGAL